MKSTRHRTPSAVRAGCRMEVAFWRRSATLISPFAGNSGSFLFQRDKHRRLTNDLMDYQLCCLDLTQDGKTLVDTELTTVSDLWLAPAGNTAKAKQVTTKDLLLDDSPGCPTADRLCQRRWQSFALNPDGSGRTLLTPNDHAIWDPSVCGDGRYIVYSAYREQKLGIWRMDADGSNPIRIADETFAIVPQCSPDGKWVIYLQGPSWTPMRVSITGEKPPETLAQDPAIVELAICLAFSPDGKRIAYLAVPNSPVENPASPSASQPNQLKVIPFDGGAPYTSSTGRRQPVSPAGRQEVRQLIMY